MSIQLKRYDTSYYVDQNYTPLYGEMCIEKISSGVYRFKIGDDHQTSWSSLSYPVAFTIGNNTFSGVQDFSSGVIDRPNLRNYAEQITNLSIVDSGISINLNSGNVYSVILSSNLTGISITGARPSGTLHSFTIIFDYTSAGYSISWPSNVLWNGGIESIPVMSSGVGRSAIVSLLTKDGGDSYFGFVGGTDFGP